MEPSASSGSYLANAQYSAAEAMDVQRSILQDVPKVIIYGPYVYTEYKPPVYHRYCSKFMSHPRLDTIPRGRFLGRRVCFIVIERELQE